jgi:hypothetical protein
MYAVVQFEKEEKKDVIEEIDETMICNDYLSSFDYSQVKIPIG